MCRLALVVRLDIRLSLLLVLEVTSLRSDLLEDKCFQLVEQVTASYKAIDLQISHLLRARTSQRFSSPNIMAFSRYLMLP